MSSKRLYGISAAILCCANLVLYLIFHIPIYVLEVSSEAWDYFRYLFTAAVEFLMPPLAAALIFFGAVRDGAHTVFSRAAVLALPRAIYLLPYYYLYETAYGYSWSESLFLTFAISGLGIIITWLHITVLFAVAYLTARRIVVKRLFSELPPINKDKKNKELMRSLNGKAVTELPHRLGDRGILDLSLPIVAGIFSICFLEFIISAVTELSDVISHLAEYGNFLVGEFVYIMAKFLLIFILLFIAHAICYGLLKRLTKENTENE